MELLSMIENYTSKGRSETYCYQAGETIYKEGEKVRGVYVLKEGYVKISKMDRSGNSKFLWSAKSGDPIGLSSFFQKTDYYRCSVKAGEESKLLFFSEKEFVQLLALHPPLKLKLLRILCERISFMEMRSKNMLYQSTDEKIVETLLFLASNKKDKKKHLRIEYSMKELNEMVGVSLGNLRKRIRNMKNKKLVDYGSNWLVINDIEKLKLIRKHQ